MSKVTPLPVDEVQNWQMIEKGLRPMLADLDAEAGDVDYILVQLQAVFERCSLGLGWSLNIKGHKERAARTLLKGMIEAIARFYQQAILALLYEVALRELELMRAKRNDPPRSAAEVKG